MRCLDAPPTVFNDPIVVITTPKHTRAGALVGGGGAGEVEQPLRAKGGLALGLRFLFLQAL